MTTAEKLFNDPKVSKQVRTKIKELRKDTIKAHHQRFEDLLNAENITYYKADNRINIPIVNSKTQNKVKLIVKQIKEEFPNLDFSTMIIVTDKFITIKDRRK